MSILSSQLWPDDMPDDRRVIAVLGMVQILEDDVDNLRKEFEKQRSYSYVGNTFEYFCNGFRAAEAKQVLEIERLNALVSMQSEKIAKYIRSDDTDTSDLEDALSATSATVSAYQNEVKAKALEDAALKMPNYANAVCFHRVYVQEAIDALHSMASELRAKGE